MPGVLEKLHVMSAGASDGASRRSARMSLVTGGHLRKNDQRLDRLRDVQLEPAIAQHPVVRPRGQVLEVVAAVAAGIALLAVQGERQVLRADAAADVEHAL